MRQVDEQDQANEQEETGARHGEVVAPDDEERVRDEEGEDDHGDPAEDLGAPEAVLDGRAAVLGGPDADEHEGHEDVEEAEGEVDALDGDEAVALLAVALDVDVVERELGELLHGPVREHDPRDDRVDEQNEGVCNAGRDAVAALSAAGAHDSAAGGRATARGGDAPYLDVVSACRRRVAAVCVLCPWRAWPGRGATERRPCLRYRGAMSWGCVVVGRCDDAWPTRAREVDAR